MKKKIALASLCIAASGTASASTVTNFDGATLGINHEVNSTLTTIDRQFSPRTVVGSNAVEYTYSSGYFIDLDGSQFTVNRPWALSNAGGLRVQDLTDNLPTILDIELVASTFSRNPTVTWNADTISVSFLNASRPASRNSDPFTATYQVKFDGLAAVPLPATLPMLLAGFGGLMLIRRKTMSIHT